jgi:hypothetical protein
MTQSPTGSVPTGPSTSDSTTETAKGQASQVGQDAKQSGQHVASVAKDEAGNVAAEAGQQAKDLLHQTRSELMDQAGQQQQRLAGGLRQLGDELSSMAENSQQSGVATDLAKQASTKAHDVAGWLDEREPGSLVEELRGFARRKPGAFLAVAAGLGFAAARMGRGLGQEHQDNSSGGGSASSGTSTSAGMAGGVVTTPVSAPDALDHTTSGGYSAYGSGAGTAVPPEPVGGPVTERPDDLSAGPADTTLSQEPGWAGGRGDGTP